MISFTLNGRRVEVDDVPPTLTLLRWLRDRAGMNGTKEGCAEGDCGACTVAFVDAESRSFRAVNSCLVFMPMIHGEEIVTVEGLSQDGTAHPVQDALVTRLGSQCGYCTPGVVMSMFEGCYRQDLDDPWKLDDQMCGNLCRCTGYRPIRDAARAVAGTRPDDRFTQVLASERASKPALEHSAGEQRFFAPDSLDGLWPILDAHPDAQLVAGGTDLALLVTKRFEQLKTVVSLESIPELSSLSKEPFEIGATVRLSDLEAFTAGFCPSIERMLRFFGSRQIKNRGTVGGNLANASPIGDLPPILLALDASVVLRNSSGRRTVRLSDFFQAYRTTALQPKEILEKVVVPPVPPSARVTAYKVSKRQELDISTVAAGFYVEVDDAQVARAARFAYGGMAATPKRADNVERAGLGRPWNRSTVETAADLLSKDFAPIDDHRGSAWYRATVARNLLIGFFLETRSDPSPVHSHRPTGTVKEVRP